MSELKIPTTVIDPDITSALYYEKSELPLRTKFQTETVLLGFIFRGEADKLESFLSQNVVGNVAVGKMSGDQTRQFRYAAIASVTLATRIAVLGGVDELEAYARSDRFSLEIDQINEPSEINALILAMLIDFADMVKHAKTSSGHSPIVKRAMRFIDERFRYKLSLSEIAAAARCGKEYLSELFKRETGKTVFHYIQSKRIEEAKLLIQKGEIELCNLGYILGFCSQSHFTKAFREETGTTPLQYKRALND